MTLANCDPEEIRRAVRLLAPEGTVVEVRALGVRTASYRAPHTESGYFNDVDALVKAVTSLRSAKGIYVTMNSVDPDLLARAANRLRAMGKGDASTTDTDIVGRIWLLIDIDPTRKSGISASAEEKEAGHQLALAVCEYLRNLGWPEPVMADSGNGFHLLFKIELPTDDGGLVERCLRALAARFDNEQATVDTGVFNPARITKLYGTAARKGDHTEARPHRMSKILEAPEVVEVVARDLLEALAANVVEQPAQQSRKAGRGRQGTARLDVSAWLREHGVEVIREGDWKDGKKIIIECPFNPDHTDDSAYVVQFGSGSLAAGCHHASCDWRWGELRDRIAPRQPRKREKRQAKALPAPAALPAGLRPVVNSPPPPAPSRDAEGGVGEVGGTNADADARPEIEVATDIEPVVDAAEEVLVAEPGVYWRGTVLVRVQRDSGVHAAQIPQSALREMLSRHARFVTWRVGKGGEPELRDILPPTWVPKTLADRGSWPHLRELRGIVETPTLRPDGSVLSTPGWDAETGLLLVLPEGTAFPPIPDSPTRADAVEAFAVLAEPSKEFRFVSEADRSAAIAYVLSLLCRHAIDGSVPLFGVSATCRGSGKGLVCDVAHIIATGREAPVAAVPADVDEWRKWLLSTAIEATATVVLDNVDFPLGNAPLASALTAGTVTGRVLGVSATATLPWRVILAATGNGLSYRADLARRVLPIRLNPGVERPEELKFERRNLKGWVREQRTELLVAALTILRAYMVAGRPDQQLPPWGSYEEWSALIRGTLVWIGCPDPADTRQEVLQAADLDADGITALLTTWHEAFGSAPVTCSQVLTRADSDAALAEALGFFATGHAHLPSSRTLGRHLHGLRGRIASGLRLVKAGSAHGHVGRWQVESIAAVGVESLPPLPPLPPSQLIPNSSGGSAGEVARRTQAYVPHDSPRETRESPASGGVGEVGESDPPPAPAAPDAAADFLQPPGDLVDCDDDEWGEL